jgi:hypothetical protein
MKKITILSLFLSAFAVNLFGYSLSGTAATAVSNLVTGNSSFVIVDTSGSDTLDSSFFTAGLTLSAGSTIGDYYVAAYNSVAGGFGTSVPGNASFNIGTGGTAAEDYFYVVAFSNHSTASVTLAGGNTFGLLSGSDWQIDSNNGATESYGAQLEQFSTINGAQFTVAAVPEPSSYALLGGLLALGCVMLRRRA